MGASNCGHWPVLNRRDCQFDRQTHSSEQRLSTSNEKETSDRISRLATLILRRDSVSHLETELAASALAQHHTSKQTNTVIGSLAAKVLGDSAASREAKELPGCILSQVRHLHGQTYTL